MLEIGGRRHPRQPSPRTSAACHPARRRNSRSPTRRIMAQPSWRVKPCVSTPRSKDIRKKELPELNDEFAQDLGDFRTVDELREAAAQGHLRPAPARSPAGGQEQDRRKAGGRARVSRCRKRSSTARCATASSRPCAPWRRKASIPARSSWTGKSQGNPARQGPARSQGFAAALADRRAGSHRRHSRRGGQGSRAHCPPAARAVRRAAHAVRKGRNAGPDRLAHPDRENPEFPVRTCPARRRMNSPYPDAVLPPTPEVCNRINAIRCSIASGASSGDNEDGIPESKLRPKAATSPRAADRRKRRIMREACRIG